MARYFDTQRGRAIAVATMGFAAGEALLPFLAVASISVIGWRWTYGVTSMSWDWPYCLWPSGCCGAITIAIINTAIEQRMKEKRSKLLQLQFPGLDPRCYVTGAFIFSFQAFLLRL